MNHIFVGIVLNSNNVNIVYCGYDYSAAEKACMSNYAKVDVIQIEEWYNEGLVSVIRRDFRYRPDEDPFPDEMSREDILKQIERAVQEEDYNLAAQLKKSLDHE